jgi:hypothetical protein
VIGTAPFFGPIFGLENSLLERLCNLPGVTGFEGPVREAIAEIVTPFVDEMRTDTLGNQIAVRRGSFCFKLMLDAPPVSRFKGSSCLSSSQGVTSCK